MFEVTEEASEAIKDLLKGSEKIPSIRVILAEGGWAGPSLGLALDEPREKDEVFDDRGLTYIIEKEFYNSLKPVKIDFIKSSFGSGFSISSSMKTGKSCGGTCSC